MGWWGVGESDKHIPINNLLDLTFNQNKKNGEEKLKQNKISTLKVHRLLQFQST